ncbi:MAG: hypothetical protein ABSH38_20425 [Verrucomicrobiota bacterium]|jgi:hypothetical protein
MMRTFIKSAGLILAWAAVQPVCAFSLWGPLEAWQTATMDYGNRYYYLNVEEDTGIGVSENGGSKNFGEGSRLTTPIVTYAFDPTFLEYFGTKGVAAVDSAMKLLNGLPSASSANLNKFLTDGNEQFNYSAQAMSLLDMKSVVMWLMLEHMGLLGETHVWDLRTRIPYGTVPCNFDYFVINRSFDPVTYNPSSYVNGRNYAYSIWDGCTAGIQVADAIETAADATQPRFTAVATPEGLQLGGFYLNVTRDDMGGLKYLYRKSNYANQGLDTDATATPFSSLISSWEPAVSNAPITTVAGTFAGLVGGVEKVTFVKVPYDSVLGTAFSNRVFTYKIPWITNSTLRRLTVTRTVVAPDVLFTAADLVVNAFPPNDEAVTRSGNFIANNVVSAGGGITPSTIAAPMVITFNKVGAIYYNVNPGFLDPYNFEMYPIFIWGSFDGSTNAPVVFPVGSSIEQLEQQVLQGGAAVPAGTWNPISLTNTTGTATGGGTGGGGGGTTGG